MSKFFLHFLKALLVPRSVRKKYQKPLILAFESNSAASQKKSEAPKDLSESEEKYLQRNGKILTS
jgi:hypothetical protein